MNNRIAIVVLTIFLTISVGVIHANSIQPLDLTNQLEALSAKNRMSFDRIANEALEESFITFRQSGIEDRARNKGDRAPNLSLPNALGEMVSINEALDEGPVVVLFYMGEWCPYCNISLRAYQRALPEIQAAGANLFAISPEKPDRSLTLIEKNDLGYEVLTDRNSRVAKKFGIAYRVDEALDAISDEIDLKEKNDSRKLELPLTAIYVIDQERIIQYAFVNVDYRKRAEPFEVVEVLQALKQG